MDGTQFNFIKEEYFNLCSFVRNMIRLTFILLLIVNLGFLGSCSDSDDEVINECIQIAQNTDWTTENFKTDFTIQFPDNYEGNGMVGFEGNTFSKTRDDSKIEFEYFFCTGTFCYDFGSALEEPIPSSIIAEDKNRNNITLDSRREFCLDGNVTGYFYFNDKENSTGKYYMKRDSVFLEALTIYFDYPEIQEIDNIIKSITEK